MPADASGGVGQDARASAAPRPEPGLELGDPQLELTDLPVETYEIDLTHGCALDCVRGVVDDVGTGNAMRPLRRRGALAAPRTVASRRAAHRSASSTTSVLGDEIASAVAAADAAGTGSTSIGYQARSGTRRPPSVQSPASIVDVRLGSIHGPQHPRSGVSARSFRSEQRRPHGPVVGEGRPLAVDRRTSARVPGRRRTAAG